MKLKSLAVIGVLSATLLTSSFAETPFALSSHILDISKGLPAPDVTVFLEKYSNNSWQKIEEHKTDSNGRLNFLENNDNTKENRMGTYRLTFETKPYFTKEKTESFYPYIEVVFEISNDKAHYHVPITLSPYGYSTYRGS